MTVNPHFAPVRPARPLGTFFRWEIPSEGISVHLNLRIIELMERDAVLAAGQPVAGVLLGRPHRGRDLTIAIEHYEMVTLEGEAPASPLADQKITDSILDRWRPGRSRMSILGLYRTTAAVSPLNSDDFAALGRVLPSAASASAPKAAEYAPRPTPIIEDPDQIFLMIGPRSERISMAKLYLVRKGEVVCESPEVPFDRSELAKIGAAGQPAPREPRPSATPEPRFSTKDIPNPVADAKAETRAEARAEAKAEAKRQPKPAKSKFQLPGRDLEVPNWMWPAIVVPVLAILLGGYFWNHGRPRGSARLVATSSEAGTTSVLGLKLDRSGSSWKLSWNENAAVVQGAVKGRLLITDGGLHRTLDLEESDLHGGTIIYTPVTDSVVLQLQVDTPDSAEPVSETVRVVGGVLPPLETPQTAASPPLETPQTTASGVISAGNASLPAAYPTASAPVNPAAAQQYPAYAAIPPPVQTTNSTQTARNFPPAQPIAPAASVPTENNRLTSANPPTSAPLVASQMPEPYRSLMMRGQSMPSAPVATPVPSRSAQVPPAYRATPQPKPVAPLSPSAAKTFAPTPKSAPAATRPTYPAYASIPVPAQTVAPTRSSRTPPAASITAKRETRFATNGAGLNSAAASRTATEPGAGAPDRSYMNQPQETVVKLTGDSGNVETAELVSRQDPDYPAKAKASGIAGDVEVHFRIAKDGHVYDVTVVHGAPMLSEAAVQAVLKWRYKPARIGGVPSDSDANATFSFSQN